MERAPSNQAATIGGIVLVGLGIVFLLQQAIGFDIGHFGWPPFVILPGLALLAAYALGPRRASGLAVPGCVVTTIGLLLAIQNTFTLWATWAYSWTLIIAAVGIGLTLQSERLGQPRAAKSGILLFELGLLGFVVFATLFELILAIGLSSALLALIGTAINLYLVRVDASRSRVEEAQLEPLQVGVHPVAQVVLHAQRDAPGDEAPGHGERKPQEARARDGDAHDHQPVPVAVLDLVDRATGEPGDGDRPADRCGRQRERPEDAPTVGAQETQ